MQGKGILMNVRDLITSLQKISDHSLEVVTYDGNGGFMHLPGPPEIIHVLREREDVFKQVDETNEEGFAVVSL